MSRLQQFQKNSTSAYIFRQCQQSLGTIIVSEALLYTFFFHTNHDSNKGKYFRPSQECESTLDLKIIWSKTAFGIAENHGKQIRLGIKLRINKNQQSPFLAVWSYDRRSIFGQLFFFKMSWTTIYIPIVLMVKNIFQYLKSTRKKLDIYRVKIMTIKAEILRPWREYKIKQTKQVI